MIATTPQNRNTLHPIPLATEILIVTLGLAVVSALAHATPPSGPVTSDYFGMTMVDADAPWPDVPVGALAKGTRVTWPYAEPNPPVNGKHTYHWATLDAWVAKAQNAGVDFFFSPGYVPLWAVQNTSSCIPGFAPPPAVFCKGMVADIANWDAYTTALVTRYRGRIKFYELWNEPYNPAVFVGPVADMVTLTTHFHDVIRAIDPSAKILCCSFYGYNAQWMDSFFAAGATKDFDIASFHAYPNPNNDIAETLNGSMSTEVVKVLNKYGFSDKPLWDTEGGWGSQPSGAITDPTLQAAFVARWLLLHWSSGTQRVYWYAWDNVQWGTLWTKTGGDTAAAQAWKEVASWMLGAVMPQSCSMTGRGIYDAVYACTLNRGSHDSRAVWKTKGNSTYSAPAQHTHYKDLQGVVHAVPGTHKVPIGVEPILLETE
jgi:polysaccharide biosynthesis protein PslG